MFWLPIDDISNRVKGIRINTLDTELFRIDYSKLEHRYNFMLALPQTDTEAIMELRLNELGVQVERGTTLISFEQTPTLVTAMVECEGAKDAIKARYLIGADGANSSVRDIAGISFPGSAMPHEWSLADVRMQSPWPVEPANILLRKEGMLFALRIKDDLYRLGSNRPNVLENLPQGLIVKETLWQTQFEVSHRQVNRYQSGCVFLVGDAAHVHAPMGARGMNMSIEDSVILIEHLINNTLDQYSSERLRVGASALRMIKAQTFLVASTNPIVHVIRQYVMPLLIKIPSVNRYLVERMLGIGYA